jgi:hypothetical protein
MEFVQKLSMYFPFISIDSPFGYVQDRLDRISNLPATIIRGNYNKQALLKFLKETDLINLHELLPRQQFQDLLYDVDLRRKVDGMSLCGFRHQEIELEIKQYITDIDPVVVKTYLNCFADFSNMTYDEKRNFVINTFEEPAEKITYVKCLENKSRDIIRAYLGVNTRVFNPIEMINRYAQIITIKINEGLRESDEVKLQGYIKLGLRSAETLDKFGVGNKDAAELLLAALAKKPEEIGLNTPKPMSVEQLEDMYLEQQKPPVM